MIANTIKDQHNELKKMMARLFGKKVAVTVDRVMWVYLAITVHYVQQSALRSFSKGNYPFWNCVIHVACF